jgi:predicted phosphodiesterase
VEAALFDGIYPAIVQRMEQMNIAGAARLVAEACGPPRGTRLVHVSDLHNRPAAFRLVSALCRTVDPALIVATGDLSGLGGPVEWALLTVLARWPVPLVFAPGNHDSALTQRCLRRTRGGSTPPDRRGAEVLSEPRLVTVAGVRVWGYPDPNRTVLGGPGYNPGLAREAASEVRPPDEGGYLIAVHSDRLVAAVPPGVHLVLCGHLHSPEVRRVGHALLVRPGAAGGTNPWSGPVRAAVVDVAVPVHAPVGVWLVEIDRQACRVEEVAALDWRPDAPK